MQACSGRSCNCSARCKITPVGGFRGGTGGCKTRILNFKTPGRYNSKRCCDEKPQAVVTSNLYVALPSKVTKSSVGNGCFDVTLSDGTSGTYVKKDTPDGITASPPQPTECSHSGSTDKLAPNSSVTEIQDTGVEMPKADGPSEGAEMAGHPGMMRAGGRHQLVDIHGLAVFLRQSTRCLSCRAACCLYVTGTISAQLAAVTQVKITCQKCHYTASQTLSRPSTAPDDQASPPLPAPLQLTPPSDSQSPLQLTATTDLRPPLPYSTSSHQNPLNLPKEEQTSPVQPVRPRVKGATVWPPPSCAIPSSGPSNKMSTLLPLQSIPSLDGVCVKEEMQTSHPSTSSLHTNNSPAALVNAQKILSTLDWHGLRHSQSPPTSPPTLPDHPVKISPSLQRSMAPTNYRSFFPCSMSHCGMSSNTDTNVATGLNLTNELGDPKESLQMGSSLPGLSTDLHLGHLHKTQTGSFLSQVPSPLSSSSSSSTSSTINPSSTSTSSFLSPPASLFPNTAASLLKLLSTSVSSSPPMPFTLPLYSALFQQSLIPEPLLETQEIKRKVEKGLEESLRLVRHMIQQGSTSQSSPTASEEKQVTDEKNAQDCLPNLPVPLPTDSTVLKNVGKASGNTSLQKSERGDFYDDKFSKRGLRNFHEETSDSTNDKCLLKLIPNSNRNKYIKKNRSKKRSKLKGRGKKRSRKEEKEHTDRKRLKFLTKHNNHGESSTSANEENKDVTVASQKSLPVIHVRLVGSNYTVQNDKEMGHNSTIPGEHTSLGPRQECRQSSNDKNNHQKHNLEEKQRSHGNILPNKKSESSRQGTAPRCKLRMDHLQGVSTCHCSSAGSELARHLGYECSLNLNCKCCPSALGSLRKSHNPKRALDGRQVRQHRQRSELGPSVIQTHAVEAEAGETANTDNSKADEHRKIDISDDIIEKLEKNIKIVMRKNKVKMAIKSLMEKNAQKSTRVQSHAGNNAVDEGEMGSCRDIQGDVRERNYCLQGDGTNTSWRFHDLISSESDSSSDTDSTDGRLFIDTDN